MDPTTDGIFIDENKNPLSILEIRDKYAKNEFLTYAPSNSKLKDLITLEKKYQQMNIYICKNMFRFIIDKQNGFGNPKKYLFFTPHNYSIKENSITNMEYRINNIPEEYKEFIPGYKKRLEEIKKEEDKNNSNINLMRKSPLK